MDPPLVVSSKSESQQVKYFMRRLRRSSTKGVPISLIEYFIRRLRPRFTSGVPNIFSKIFSQKASPTICDSLFELIPNIFSKIYYKGLRRQSMIRSSSSFRIYSLKYFLRRLRRQSVIRSSSSFQIYSLKYFLRRLRRQSVNGVPNIFSKIFCKKASPTICERRSKYIL